jgi:glycosyltransferase involved in cell wall biosynthesis
MSPSSTVFINMRSQAAGLRGVQRYTIELRQRLGSRLREVAPSKPLLGVKGHLWEQGVLPSLVRRGCLWSPANTGPLSIENQVLTIHDVAPLEHPEWFNAKFVAWYRWLTPILSRRVRKIITVSQFSKERLLQVARIDESKVVIIPEGVDGRFNPQSPDEVNSVRAELNLPSVYYLLSVGALEPRKNLRSLLAAWSLCLERLPKEVWLVIAGPKAPANVFADLNLDQPPPRVHFTGFVADTSLPPLYSGALALVYLSVYEGFGLPALEAMAAGTTPIVANNSSLPEVVGGCGIVVDPYDLEAITAAIVRVVEDASFRLSCESRAAERSKIFNWDRSADLTWTVLAEANAN